MTTKEFARDIVRTRATVGRYLDEWIPTLGLKWWEDIVIEYACERSPSLQSAAAICEVNAAYLQATITFYLPVLIDKTDEYIENTVVHELCHLLVGQLAQAASNRKKRMFHETVELTVVKLAQAFLWTKRHYQPKPKPVKRRRSK